MGFILVTAVATALGAALGAPLAVAIGLGAFVGFWGGVGFAGMLCGTLAMTRVQRGASGWAGSPLAEDGPDERIGAEPGAGLRDQLPTQVSEATRGVRS
jgi:hypothetical protein